MRFGILRFVFSILEFLAFGLWALGFWALGTFTAAQAFKGMVDQEVLEASAATEHLLKVAEPGEPRRAEATRAVVPNPIDKGPQPQDTMNVSCTHVGMPCQSADITWKAISTRRKMW